MHNQPREPQPLWGLSSKIDSRIWVNFTRNGPRLWSRHQEPPHIDVSRNLATVVVRGVLPGLRRRRTGLLPSVQSPLFIWEDFLYLETKVLESGGRVEKLIAQVVWSPVLSFHSLWWFGVQCHLLVFENQCHCTHLPRNFGALHASFCWPAFKDADFIFQQNLAPAHTAKAPKVG